MAASDEWQAGAKLRQRSAIGPLTVGEFLELAPATRPFQPDALGDLTTALESGQIVPLCLAVNNRNKIEGAAVIMERLSGLGVGDASARRRAALCVERVLRRRVAVGAGYQHVYALARTGRDERAAFLRNARMELIDVSAVEHGVTAQEQ